MAASVETVSAAQNAGAIRGASILPPSASEMLGRRTTRLPAHLVAAVGCHGGAGVSTLAAQLEHVGDSGQLWPGRADEPPFAVLVARESARGLAAASLAARQYATNNAPAHVQLLGLVLVAGRKGKPTARLRRDRELLVGSGLFANVWHISWHDFLVDTPLNELPSTGPDPAPAARRADPRTVVAPDIAAVGQGLRDAAVAVMSGDSGTTP